MLIFFAQIARQKHKGSSSQRGSDLQGRSDLKGAVQSRVCFSPSGRLELPKTLRESEACRESPGQWLRPLCRCLGPCSRCNSWDEGNCCVCCSIVPPSCSKILSWSKSVLPQVKYGSGWLKRLTIRYAALDASKTLTLCSFTSCWDSLWAEFRALESLS